jgi:hypothetical protein
MTGPEFVILPGLTLPLPAVRLALDLEQRGLQFLREGHDLLLRGPCERVTEDDRVQIRRWKLHLLAIADYDVDAHRPPC